MKSYHEIDDFSDVPPGLDEPVSFLMELFKLFLLFGFVTLFVIFALLLRAHVTFHA